MLQLSFAFALNLLVSGSLLAATLTAEQVMYRDAEAEMRLVDAISAIRALHLLTHDRQQEPLNVDTWLERAKTAVVLRADLQSLKDPEANRHSGFYLQGAIPVIFVDLRKPNLSTELLLHEFLKDEEYQLSAGLGLLLEWSQREDTKSKLMSEAVARALGGFISQGTLEAGFPLSVGLSGHLRGVTRSSREANQRIEISSYYPAAHDLLLGGELAGGGGDEFSLKAKQAIIRMALEQTYEELKQGRRTAEVISLALSQTYKHLASSLHVERNPHRASEVGYVYSSRGALLETFWIETLELSILELPLDWQENQETYLDEIFTRVKQTHFFMENLPSSALSLTETCLCGVGTKRTFLHACPRISAFHPDHRPLMEINLERLRATLSCR